MRFENWKIVFAEQRCQGTLRTWAEPFTPLRVPKLFNLRTDPFEYADITSNTYYEWFLRRDFFVFYATAMASAFLDTFKEFPPRHPPASFSIDQIVKKLTTSWRPTRCWNCGPTAPRSRRSSTSWGVSPPRAVRISSHPAARVAVFDNDGTLWCEKPMYIQLDFLLRRFKEQAEADPSLRAKQPYQAAYTGDLKWLGDAVTKHYQGDDTDMKPLMAAILTSQHEITVDELRGRFDAFLRRGHASDAGSAVHQMRVRADGRTPALHWRPTASPTTSCPVAGAISCGPITERLYGIPPERVVGSSVGLIYHDGDVYTTAEPEFVDDGPIKPVRLWSRIGRRPIFAAGNSNGDIEMLEFTDASKSPSLQLLILHDDAEREFDYVGGAEKSLDLAAKSGWTVVSMHDDWATIFSD